MSYPDRADRGTQDVDDHLQVVVQRVGAVTIGTGWRYDDLCAPYWRIYVDKNDGARLLPRGGRAVPLRAGRVVLVPAWVHFATAIAGPVEHVYGHFDVPGLPGATVRVCFPQPVALPDGHRLGRDLIALGDALDAGRPLTPAVLCAWKAVIHAALADALERLPAEAHARCVRAVREDGPLRAALDLVRREPAADLGNTRLAARCGVSTDHLIRLFRRHLGQTPSAYVGERRIAAAARELAATDTAIDDIARRCGFADRFSFSKAFAKRMGLPPAAWRRRNRGVMA